MCFILYCTCQKRWSEKSKIEAGNFFFFVHVQYSSRRQTNRRLFGSSTFGMYTLSHEQTGIILFRQYSFVTVKWQWGVRIAMTLKNRECLEISHCFHLCGKERGVQSPLSHILRKAIFATFNINQERAVWSKLRYWYYSDGYSSCDIGSRLIGMITLSSQFLFTLKIKVKIRVMCRLSSIWRLRLVGRGVSAALQCFIISLLYPFL